jgi:redox-sensitive bicupin YhaK (pirin superfamily)
VYSGRQVSDGAGVKLSRVIGAPPMENLDPFLLFDEFRSDDPNDYIAGFPAHPHRGFETVTYMLAGSMEHRDSVGNCGRLEAGSVQWMTAGRGIIHSEMPRQEDGLMWGFQLWVNLPAAAKMISPRYQEIPSAEIPEVSIDDGGGIIRVIAGMQQGVSGPIQGVHVAPMMADVHLVAGGKVELDIPTGHTCFVYVYEGHAWLGADTNSRGSLVRSRQLAVLDDGDGIVLQTESDVGRAVVVAGRPLNEPIVRRGPFVMNNWEQIVQAVEDYRRGTFCG